jgi:hypothetical protein
MMINELERMWKEAVDLNLRYYPYIGLEAYSEGPTSPLIGEEASFLKA